MMRQVVLPRERLILHARYFLAISPNVGNSTAYFVLLKLGQHLKVQDLFLPPTLLKEYSGFLSIYKLPGLYLQFL